MSKPLTRHAIWDHVRSIGTCMMVTRSETGVRARPMRGILRPEENAIWFFADQESDTDKDVRENPEVCLTFTDTRDNVFVSLSGGVTRVLEKATIVELWDDAASGYFPNGPDDPRVVLLRFEPDMGEYWTAPSSRIVLAIKFLEAKLLGERPSLGARGRTQLP
jgi:general stress protein 26